MSENVRKEDFSMEKTAMCEAYFYFACTTGESYDFDKISELFEKDGDSKSITHD